MADTAVVAPNGLKKDGTPKAKRGEGPGAKPRPAYIVYDSNDDGTINVRSATRNAEEVLKTVDANRDLKYVRFEIK